jgi:hypothetical protein
MSGNYYTPHHPTLVDSKAMGWRMGNFVTVIMIQLIDLYYSISLTFLIRINIASVLIVMVKYRVLDQVKHICQAQTPLAPYCSSEVFPCSLITYLYLFIFVIAFYLSVTV